MMERDGEGGGGPSGARPADPTALPRHLSAVGGAAVIAGTIVGSGIWVSPGAVLRRAGSPGASLLLWVVGGVAALLGGLSYAELGSAMPQSGGEAVYLRRAYGEQLAFLFAWTNSCVTRPSSIAIVCNVCGDYLSRVGGGPPGDWTARIASICCLFICTVVMIFALRGSAKFQTVITGVKLFALAGVMVVGMAFGEWGELDARVLSWENTTSHAGDTGIALNAALWAFDGWANLNQAIGEMNDPQHLPYAIGLGTLACVVLYLLANLGYLLVLGPRSLAATDAAAGEFAEDVFGLTAGHRIAGAVVGLSTFGTCMAVMYSGSRLVHSQAAEGHFFSWLAWVSPKFETPVNAIASQFFIAFALLFAGDFESLVSYFGASAWVFYGATVAAVPVLRYREPGMERPFRVHLAVPMLFCCFAVSVVVMPILSAPLHVGLALGIIVLGLPARYAWRVVCCRSERWRGLRSGSNAGIEMYTDDGGSEHASTAQQSPATKPARAGGASYAAFGAAGEATPPAAPSPAPAPAPATGGALPPPSDGGGELALLGDVGGSVTI
eukprot:TRINITY_DN4913_c0_g1_i1.p1 TRINITY_DN4913_c0_g1~~TRINITY_DN4913_c0_g1_i1.p1  ORF type:complete len:578 (+),score=140.76 TRINITY_DN4913_c0_g1_i1:78-1736(+)